MICNKCIILDVIKSFAHKGLKRLFESGDASGVNPAHAKKLSIQLDALNRAKAVDEMNVASWNLHPLKGNMAGRWSVKVNANWRMTLEMEEGHAHVVDYEDYH